MVRFIEGFGSIQVEAARLDSQLSMLAAEKAAEGAMHATSLSPGCCTIAFVLVLYSVHEFLYICWYPYELLIGFIVSALTRIENNLLAQEEYADHQNKIPSSSNSAKNRQPNLKNRKKQQTPYR